MTEDTETESHTSGETFQIREHLFGLFVPEDRYAFFRKSEDDDPGDEKYIIRFNKPVVLELGQ